MRTYAFSLVLGGQIRVTSSMLFTWKLAENHSRASRKRGSRRSSNSRNIKLTCSFVTSPMFPPLDCCFCTTTQTDFHRRWARKSMALEHPASVNIQRAVRDDDSYDS